MIPGSSLRGMTRSLVEILAHGSLRWVSDRRLVHRAVGDASSLGIRYRERFLGDAKNPGAKPPLYDYPSDRVRGGYLRWRRGDAFIQPAKEVFGETLVLVEYEAARLGAGVVPRAQSDKARYGPQDVIDVWLRPPSGRTPHVAGNGQAALEMACVSRPTDVQRRKAGQPAPAGFEPAVLLRSGHMGGPHPKHRHCAVYEPDPARAAPTSWLPVEPDVWRAYAEDRDLHRGIPCRRLTHDGKPLVYLVDDLGRLVFFGPTLFFRLPHDRTVLGLVPPAARGGAGELELADALFGTVEAKDGAVKGRVFFEDALWTDRGAGPPFLEGDGGRRSPKILSEPKPTAFQHYLAQPEPDSSKTLRHWSDDLSETEVRGFKRYWHKPGASDSDRFETGLRTDTQHTIIRPVRPRTRFAGRVRFENLGDLELGALLTALELPPTKRHHLGMGKPLGLGTVRIEATLHLVDRRRRYARLLAPDRRAESGEIPATETREAGEAARSVFEQAILGHAATQGDEEAGRGPSTLWEVPRLAELALLLEWDKAPPPAATGYSRPEHQGQQKFKWWRERPVLPDPRGVVEGGSEAGGRGRRSAGAQSPSKWPHASGTQRAAPASVIQDEFHTGQRVRVVVLEEKTKKGKPRFQVKGGAKRGVLHPQSPEPPELSPGRELELVVRAPGATLQLAWPGDGEP